MTPPIPQVIRIEPAASCNLTCGHCPTGRGLAPKGVMTRATFARVLDAIRPHAPYRSIVLYHGGEPLLNQHFVKMVQEVRPLGRLIKTVTNGTLLETAEAAEAVVASGLDEIEVSIDGSSPEENDRIRKGSRFSDLIATVIRLIEAKRRRRSSIRIAVANVRWDGGSPTVPAALQRDLREVLGEVVFKVTAPIEWPAFAPSAVTPIASTYCDHVWGTLTIRWNGDVVPCCYDLTSRVVLGNVVKLPLSEIWYGDPARQIRSEIASGSPPDLCRGCPVIYAPAASPHHLPVVQ